MKILFLFNFLCTILFSKEILLTSRNTINFDQAFDLNYIATKQIEILELIENNKDIEEFYIVVHSPGGSVSAGQQFFGFLKGLNKKFHTITIFAASMGFQMVQGLGERYITEYGVLMSHRASLGGLAGQFPGDLNNRLKMYERSVEMMDEIAAKRAKISLYNYKKLIHDELWLVGQDAVKMNFADKIVYPKCDKSLNEIVIKTINTPFGPVSVEKSKCPLITGLLSLKFDDERAKIDYLNKIDINRVRSEI